MLYFNARSPEASCFHVACIKSKTAILYFNVVVEINALSLVAPLSNSRSTRQAVMSGRGNGSHGRGQGGAARHRKVIRDDIQFITRPAIRRVARRAGVIPISGFVYHETRAVLRMFLVNLIH
ncbi:hypothetical protein PC129_g10137 [Phytophthora cactorum]|uniref:Histone-fold n=1 Tax=Phytophthora cactorum TaxID=29920 RepID=A0A8T1FUP8_9STRA|nr:hypothetical protein PC115_g19888 [Phytophthora cactorum]KAG2902070.1 hypothetical protein PC114_g12887 [Phytophthora cactorum]KAG2935114.1 hypothetical protein PC117_g12463 [Phytophthora cactorum]KAG2979891.1 hypothetical protein PC118_g11509 [Phytophthora cactorum]KAG2996959.1 hypothetical protein PC120_g21378 [Phytophthora cactorum]